MATALADVYTAKANAFAAGAWPDILEMVGQDSAALMETLGDILNNMDAVDEYEDAWTYPVLEAAQRLFPSRDRDGGSAGDACGSTAKQHQPDPKGIAK